MIKCQYAAPGTYGHECGSPATHLLITVMDSETKAALRCMGATVSADGLSRAGRCEAHRNVREHEAKLRQVYAASVDRSGERRRELAMADAYEGTCD